MEGKELSSAAYSGSVNSSIIGGGVYIFIATIDTICKL
jgi:hypothetical protein